MVWCSWSHHPAIDEVDEGFDNDPSLLLLGDSGLKNKQKTGGADYHGHEPSPRGNVNEKRLNTRWEEELESTPSKQCVLDVCSPRNNHPWLSTVRYPDGTQPNETNQTADGEYATTKQKAPVVESGLSLPPPPPVSFSLACCVSGSPPPNRAAVWCRTRSLGGFLLPARPFRYPWAAYAPTLPCPASKRVRGGSVRYDRSGAVWHFTVGVIITATYRHVPGIFQKYPRRKN